jgi:alpha-beta hydrolase superfamily lysophospholipase
LLAAAGLDARSRGARIIKAKKEGRAMAEKRDFVLVSSGLSIKGSLMLPAGLSRRPLAILCHGIPSGAPTAGEPGYEVLAERLAGEGLAACWFNFRGTGASDGNFSLPGWVDDLNALLSAADSGEEPFQYCQPARKALVGFSAGGAVSIVCASRMGVGEKRKLRALAAISSPSDFTRLLNREGLIDFIRHARDIGIIRDPGFPASQEEYYAEMLACRALDFVSGLSPIPLLVMHGDQDDVVPLEEARRLYEAAGEPKEIAVIPGGGHRLRLNEPAMDAMISWLVPRLAG